MAWDYSKNAVWSIRSYPTKRAERVLASLRERKFPDCPVTRRKCNNSSGFACGGDRCLLYLDRAHEDNPRPALGKLDNARRGNTLETPRGQRAGHFPLIFWIAEIKGWKRKGGNVLLETDPGWEGGLGMTADLPLSPCNVSNVRKLPSFQPSPRLRETQGLWHGREQNCMCWATCVTATKLCLPASAKTKAHLLKILGLVKDGSSGERGVKYPYDSATVRPLLGELSHSEVLG